MTKIVYPSKPKGGKKGGGSSCCGGGK